MYHLFNNYGGKDMMYRTELLEEITIENATVRKWKRKAIALSQCHFGEPKGLYWFSKKD